MILRIRRWSTRKLRSGDLTALAAIADGSAAVAECVDRLARRRFVAKKPDGRIVVTLRGHMALVIKRARSR